MKRSIITLATLAALFAVPSAAMAHSYWTCNGKIIKWKDEAAHLRHSAVSFPNGSSYRTASADAINKANENASEMRFSRSWDDGSVKTGNGQNEVWFTNSDFGAPARAVTKWGGIAFCANPRIKESDLQFSTGTSYTSSMSTSLLWGYGGNWRPFRTTMMHELGHAMGLGHENRRYNIMGEDWTHIHANNGVARAYMGEDAGHGLVAMYGLVAGGLEDLSVTHWEFAGADGEYSQHKRCGMRAANGAALASFWNNGEEVRRVRRGQSIKVEFTYENNGKSFQVTDAGFYLSANDNITTLDPRIGGWSLQLGRDVVATATRTVTIPANAPLGYQWLGVIIDENGTLGEVSEVNNKTYHRVWIDN